jgi:hypothetical protein
VTLVALVEAAAERLRANGVLVQLGGGYAIATVCAMRHPVLLSTNEY